MKLFAGLKKRDARAELRRAYAAWAPLYDVGPGNPIQRANDAALALCLPRAPERGVAIDLGCGTGHHALLLRGRGWQRTFGFDLSPEMLQRADGFGGRAIADLHRIPARPVELVLCSQVLGHVERLELALGALARVVRYRGDLVLSELHPAAIEAGMRATFPGSDGRWWRLPHRAHPISEVVDGLQRHGLAVQLVTEPAPEPPLPGEPPRPPIPLVYALRARRVVG